MSIFAISDLHLTQDAGKKMDIFGTQWIDHFAKIAADWNKVVDAQDLVLVPGDLSWAMNIEEAKPDIAQICGLPGKKLLLRGNHDYWWSSLTKVQQIIFHDTYLLQNDCFLYQNYLICGSRGWICPWDKNFTEADEKVMNRECIRLKLSLDRAMERRKNDEQLIVMMHFPPIYPNLRETPYVSVLRQYPVSQVVFGHLHGSQISKTDFDNIKKDGIEYHLVSCDYLDFQLKKII